MLRSMSCQLYCKDTPRRPSVLQELQERSVHPTHGQGDQHGKKRTKKQKKQNGAEDSSKAYYDVYGQEVSAVHTSMSGRSLVQSDLHPACVNVIHRIELLCRRELESR